MFERMIAIAIVLAAGSTAGVARQEPVAQRLVRVSEWSMRRSAVESPVPDYPPASLEAGVTGVAVAAVAFSADGPMTTVVILESPDEHTGAALREALLRWRFTPVWYPGPEGAWVAAGGRGKLTFYFEVVGGMGRVRGADEMPGARVPPRSPYLGAGPPSAPPPPPPSGPPSSGAAPPAASGVRGAGAAVIDDAGLAVLLAAEKAVMLDPRDRAAFRLDGRAGAVNIPLDELDVRGPIELPSDRPVVIDCREQEWRCRAYAGRVESHVARVLIYIAS
jgi:hypothetical protein